MHANNLPVRYGTSELSPYAPEFSPDNLLFSLSKKQKKTKDLRACPRRRRRKFARNGDQDLVSVPYDIRTNPNPKNLISYPLLLPLVSHDRDDGSELLELQNEWRNSKIVLGEEDYLLEEIERKKWRAWAVFAAETERRRRINLLKELDLEEAKERVTRRRWAIDAIERERNERVSKQFLATLSSTSWFHRTISNYNDDYELVCFYFRLGCREKCRRSTLNQHLKTCVFALESKSSTLDNQSAIIDVDNYLVRSSQSLELTCNVDFFKRRKWFSYLSSSFP